MRVSDDHCVDFLWLDVHREDWLTLEQDAIIHQDVCVVAVYKKRRAAYFFGSSHNLYFQFIILLLKLLTTLVLNLAN